MVRPDPPSPPCTGSTCRAAGPKVPLELPLENVHKQSIVINSAGWQHLATRTSLAHHLHAIGAVIMTACRFLSEIMTTGEPKRNFFQSAIYNFFALYLGITPPAPGQELFYAGLLLGATLLLLRRRLLHHPPPDERDARLTRLGKTRSLVR